MSLGVLSSKRTLGGLVAVAADCWDAPGFKDCHTKAWEQARLDCKPAYMDPMTQEMIYLSPDATTFYRNNPNGTEAKCIEYVDPILTVNRCSSLCPKKPKPTTPVVEAPVTEEAPRGPSGKVMVIGAIALFGLYVFMKEN
jgi:hypothetical protein